MHGVNACDRSATDDEVNNKLAAFFSPMRNTGTPDCIDYIYLGNSPQTTLRPFRAEVLRDWKYDTAPDFGEMVLGARRHLSGRCRLRQLSAADRDKLCAVVKTTDNRLQVAMLDRATGRWTHSILKQDGADIVAHGAPTIVWFYDTLHLFYQQHGNVLKLEFDRRRQLDARPGAGVQDQRRTLRRGLPRRPACFCPGPHWEPGMLSYVGPPATRPLVGTPVGTGSRPKQACRRQCWAT